jgi:HPt (histidine-containing phosphotransfer) domain-containing protein
VQDYGALSRSGSEGARIAKNGGEVAHPNEPVHLTLASEVSGSDPDVVPDARSDEPPLDERELAGLRQLQQEGEPDFVGELIELFLNDAPPRLAALREAVEAGDARSVERIAHTLNGSSASMGAKRMASLCAQLQEDSASGSEDLARARELLERLEAEFERVHPALEDELARSRG